MKETNEQVTMRQLELSGLIALTRGKERGRYSMKHEKCAYNNEHRKSTVECDDNFIDEE